MSPCTIIQNFHSVTKLSRTLPKLSPYQTKENLLYLFSAWLISSFAPNSRAQIWRFKEENRALMRRLYGDLESNSVYREMRASNMASAAEEAKVTYTYDV